MKTDEFYLKKQSYQVYVLNFVIDDVFMALSDGI